jgi:2,3-bisphosphoglycerate-independent phosphoglycerate mutase
VVLIILDGFGANPSKLNNAIAAARTPRLDQYFARYPHTTIYASGLAVGLPDGQMGNSEVGHMILGSGTIVRQDLVLIDDTIQDRSFYDNRVLIAAADAAAAAGRPIHLYGLVSDGGVHSHVRHLLALIELCKRHGARPVLHMVTDGRDTPPKSAISYLKDVEKSLTKAGGAIATVTGRYYAMDRDRRWDRTEKAFRAFVYGEGRPADSARQAIEAAYEAGETDEFIMPTVIAGAERIQPGDQVISFNFRKDRPRQMVKALGVREFEDFDRGDFKPVRITGMMEYEPRYRLPYAFGHEKPSTTLSKLLADAGLRQFHCAETEKYAHVTYFFNGGRREPLPGEEHHLIPSPKVATYDLQPEMSAPQVADAVIEAIDSEDYAFIVVNFANGDMVGHTGVWEAAVAAVETLDREVGRVLDAAVAHDYSVVLTADHGNCDEMRDPTTDGPHTQHTVYPVPFLVIDQVDWRLSTQGGLSNVAPTVLHLMGLTRPPEMIPRSMLLQPLR